MGFNVSVVGLWMPNVALLAVCEAIGFVGVCGALGHAATRGAGRDPAPHARAGRRCVHELDLRRRVGRGRHDRSPDRQLRPADDAVGRGAARAGDRCGSHGLRRSLRASPTWDESSRSCARNASRSTSSPPASTFPCSRSATSTSATARCRSCSTSISTSARARPSPCWERTARGSRRCLRVISGLAIPSRGVVRLGGHAITYEDPTVESVAASCSSPEVARSSRRSPCARTCAWVRSCASQPTSMNESSGPSRRFPRFDPGWTNRQARSPAANSRCSASPRRSSWNRRCC